MTSYNKNMRNQSNKIMIIIIIFTKRTEKEGASQEIFLKKIE